MVQFGRIVLDRLNSHPRVTLRFAQGQALSAAKGLSRSAARSFAALRMTGPDLAGGEALASAFEPCLKPIIGAGHGVVRRARLSEGHIQSPGLLPPLQTSLRPLRPLPLAVYFVNLDY